MTTFAITRFDKQNGEYDFQHVLLAEGRVIPRYKTRKDAEKWAAIMPGLRWSSVKIVNYPEGHPDATDRTTWLME